MTKILYPATVMILSLCIVLPFAPLTWTSSLTVTPFRTAFMLLVIIIAGVIGMRLLGMRKHYFFVCGRCNSIFMDERTLCSHYFFMHLKKGEEEDRF